MDLVWIIVLAVAMGAVTLGAAWRRRWVPFALYALADILQFYDVGQDKDGWEELAFFVKLLVIVLPIYAVATAIWVYLHYRQGKRSAS